jgi:energy-coupling factor transport system ATP-binding protein
MFAQRVVLMGEGELIADGDPHDVLAGGWYFATETARVCGALTPEEGAGLIREKVRR